MGLGLEKCAAEDLWERAPQSVKRSYAVHDELGSGAYGVVMAVVARDAAHRGEEFAAKVAEGPEGKSNLRQEADCLKLLDHPNVVQLKESILPNLRSSSSVLILERAEGCMIGRLLNEDLSRGLIQDFSRQLLNGLAHCHNQGVVHCDIKPDNLLLFPGNVLKLADFGLAKTRRALSSTFEVRGTIAYMAPELLIGRGHIAVGASIDMWAAACTVATMAAKEMIFEGSRQDAGSADEGNRSEFRRRRTVGAMCRILGTPRPFNCPALAVAQHAVRLPELEAQGLATAFPALPELLGGAGLALVENLLRYHPTERWSAQEALRAQYFEEELSDVGSSTLLQAVGKAGSATESIASSAWELLDPGSFQESQRNEAVAFDVDAGTCESPSPVVFAMSGWLSDTGKEGG